MERVVVGKKKDVHTRAVTTGPLMVHDQGKR